MAILRVKDGNEWEEIPAIKGDDGYSPTVETSKSGKTTTITITDISGEHTATILDGEDSISNYLHVQSVASDEWVINHNLNKYPSVTVIDSADNEVIGEIEYVDLNNLKIKFQGGFSGKATLN